MSGRSHGGRSLAIALLLTLVCGAAFAVRIVQFRGMPPGERVVFADPDSLYHLRITRAVAADFPRVPAFDWYLNYPAGAEIPLPPFQDLLGAAVSRLLPAGGGALEMVCFLYPAVLGALAPLAVFAIARLAGLGSVPGLLAALLSSWGPSQINYTIAGRYDHHAGDMALSLLAFALLLALWRTRSAAARGLPAAIALAGTALVLAAGAINFLGAILHAAVLAAIVAAGALLLRDRDAFPAFAARAAAATGAAAALVAAFVLAAYGPARLLRLQYDLLSGFHPAALAAAAAFLGLVALLASRGARSLRLPGFWVLGAVLALLGAALLGQVTAGAGRYFTTRTDVMLSVQENLSPFLYQLGFRLPRPSLRAGASALTYAYLLIPAAVAWLGVRAFRPARDFSALALAVWIGAYAALAVSQYRYGPTFAAPAGIAAAWLAAEFWSIARRKGAPGALRAGALFAAALCLATFFPGFLQLRYKLDDPYSQIANADLRRPMAWLAANSPAPGEGFDPARRPAYGVMTFWDAGYNVIAQGDRPAVATGYLDTVSRETFRDSVDFFLERSPDHAGEIMARNRLRYLLLRDLPETLAKIATLRGPAAPPPGGGAVPSVAERLWSVNGSATLLGGEMLAATRRFRLLREDYFHESALGRLRQSKIFEFVPGARLAGSAPPGAVILARLDLRGGSGQVFSYRDTVSAGPDGRYELTVPYASAGANGDTVPIGRWRVSVVGSPLVAPVSVGEIDVLEGRVVAVDAGRPDGATR